MIYPNSEIDPDQEIYPNYKKRVEMRDSMQKNNKSCWF